MTLIVTGCDLETTGIDAEKGAQIIEIGLAIYGTNNGVDFKKLSKTFLRRCMPTVPIEKGAYNVHGISLDDLKGEKSWLEIAPTVSKILARTDVFVAHNVAFDAPFLVTELLRAEQPMPDLFTFCTMENGRTATALGKLPNLGELCWAFDVDYDADTAHAADYDIERTMQCFFKGLKAGRFNVPLITELREKTHD